AFIVKEEKAVTMLSNVSALLNVFMDEINWVGFYLKDDEKLYLGPFQGLPACTEIKIGQGVCGTSAAKKETLIVDDVHAFPGHIACDGASQSEIVVPIVIDNEVYGVIDVDSPVKNRFNALDKRLLEKVATYIVDFLK
ncbi:MAG: GAF domain-containing protein, partial [Acholeplasmataceae bacterium]|nr:GAF domain-containing protein [Acholeplasmataceae bacterium]